MDKIYEYCVGIRRKLHQYPELGFDLEKTVEIVSKELDKIGITYTHSYGKGSVVAHLGQGDKIVALRADMDALPIIEKTGLEYSSKIKGQMHACGHDAHTAILLAVSKYLKEHEAELPCRVRLIFQPSEEGTVSGAKMMVENGVCEEIDHIICTHCENMLEAGKFGICKGDYMAACIPATIRFIGKSSHATLPQFGVDANAMAVEAYQKMNDMLKKESGEVPYIWSVGRILGGQVHNVISDLCEMDISFRFYDTDFAEHIKTAVFKICNDIARTYGGRVEINWQMSTCSVFNDEKIAESLKATATGLGITVDDLCPKMSSEDFGWYLTKVPGVLFRFGTRNELSGCTALAHRDDFCIDEQGMKTAIQIFCAYVMSL